MLNSRMRQITLSLAATALLAAPIGAAAHHSYAPYDDHRTVVLEGTVSDLQWKNPHTRIMLKTSSGVWDLEGSSPNTLTRAGWKKAELQVGVKLKVSFNPRRDGAKAGFFKGVALSDGRTMGAFKP